jgi:ABC-2 type transport system ATP-binding protein
MAEPLIRAAGLTKRYGTRTVVDHLDLEVHRGEVYGLLGPNGAGKTTTILMLLGLSEPDSGEARVVGLDPTRHALDVKRRVGYLPDDVGFYPDLSGRENLRYTAALNGLRGKQKDDRVSEVLERVGLTEAADRKAGQYSRGMRQRLGIADALVKDPSVLILDEPTIGIDPLGVIEILTIIRQLVRAGIFYAGRLIGEGTLAELGRRFGGARVRMAVAFEDPREGLDRDAVLRLLASLPGVASADLADAIDPATGLDAPLPLGTVGWVLSLADGATASDVRHELLRRVSEAGLPLAELRLLVPSLGEIYRRALETETDAAERVAQASVA